ncbi:MAG: SDR family NAD(P)-dependent oxidoreductase [Acidobacteriota bacterium]|nr:SDR family NAD(P)-dependent oxidoreductase [Acidobacteriota bacterium]
MDSVENKIALVTGSSSGIGKAAAIALKEAGFIVYATAPNADDLADLKAKGCETLPLDVTDENAAREAIRTAESHNGAVQVLVNNAGFGQYGPIEEIPIDDIRQNFEVNVFGLLRLCQLVLPKMREAGGGRIINVSSVAGEMSQPGSGIYHATKHAVEAIDEALRIEVSSFNIQVVGILPGPVNTNFDEVAVAQIPDTGKDSPYYIFKENLAKATREMLKPGGTGVLEPEDIAAKIVEAATATSPSARYHVGVMSKVMGKAHDFLPDVVWDAAMKMNAPSMDKRD